MPRIFFNYSVKVAFQYSIQSASPYMVEATLIHTAEGWRCLLGLEIAANVINSRTELGMTLVQSWTRLCSSTSPFLYTTNRALKMIMYVSTSLIAISKEPGTLFDPDGRFSSRTSIMTKFSIFCRNAQSTSSLCILRSLWCNTSVMKMLGIYLQLRKNFTWTMRL